MSIEMVLPSEDCRNITVNTSPCTRGHFHSEVAILVIQERLQMLDNGLDCKEDLDSMQATQTSAICCSPPFTIHAPSESTLKKIISSVNWDHQNRNHIA